MTFGDWIRAQPGRASAAAAFFTVSASAISQWAAHGVPLARMKAVREFTAGAVTLEEMVPGPADGFAEVPVAAEVQEALHNIFDHAAIKGVPQVPAEEANDAA